MDVPLRLPEIGHYLLNTHVHHEKAWNLMRDAQTNPSLFNADLLLGPRTAIHHTPEAVNSDDD